MNPVAPNEKHLNADGFSAFVDNAMSEQERLEVIAHIADCGQCREVIVLLQEANSVAEPVAQARSVRGGGRAFMIGGIAVLVAAVGTLAFVLGRQSRVQPVPPQVIVQNVPAVATPAQQPTVQEHKPSNEPTAKPKQIASAPAPNPIPSPPVESENSGTEEQGGWRSNPLPSNLPAIAVVSRVHQKLAGDASSNLFLSRDGGAHWRSVPQQWTGKIVRLGTSSGPADAQVSATSKRADGATIPSAGKSRFELTTDTGGVWISYDGVHWRVP